MFAIVYGIVRAGAAGWGDRLTVASLVGGAVLLTLLRPQRAPGGAADHAAAPVREPRARRRVRRAGAVRRRDVRQFFFLTQYLQGVRGYSPLEAGVAFLPLTLVMFAMVHVVPRLVARFGNSARARRRRDHRVLGMAWLSRVGTDTPYLTGDRDPDGDPRARRRLRVHAADHGRRRRRRAARTQAPLPASSTSRTSSAARSASACSSPSSRRRCRPAPRGPGSPTRSRPRSPPATAMLALALAVVLVVGRRPRPVAELVELPLVEADEQLAA